MVLGPGARRRPDLPPGVEPDDEDEEVVVVTDSAPDEVGEDDFGDGEGYGEEQPRSSAGGLFRGMLGRPAEAVTTVDEGERPGGVI